MPLDPELRKRVANLKLSARRAVDGLLSGIHRSPHRGASVVFVEHREYRPGDDLRLLDWRAYARTDRHTIKRFEQETQLGANLVLDVSASMNFAGSSESPSGPRKSEYAASLLAALGLVLLRQGDAAGLTRIDVDIAGTLPPRSRPGHLELLLDELVQAIESEPRRATDLRAALSAVAERSRRRGLVAIASDLLDLNDAALAPIAQLVHFGHEVWVFQVLTPDELDFPYEGPARFVGLESEESVELDPSGLRGAYLAEMQQFLANCRARCTQVGARYRLARTDEAVERVLAELLLSGSRRR